MRMCRFADSQNPLAYSGTLKSSSLMSLRKQLNVGYRAQIRSVVKTTVSRYKTLVLPKVNDQPGVQKRGPKGHFSHQHYSLTLHTPD